MDGTWASLLLTSLTLNKCITSSTFSWFSPLSFTIPFPAPHWIFVLHLMSYATWTIKKPTMNYRKSFHRTLYSIWSFFLHFMLYLVNMFQPAYDHQILLQSMNSLSFFSSLSENSKVYKVYFFELLSLKT